MSSYSRSNSLSENRESSREAQSEHVAVVLRALSLDDRYINCSENDDDDVDFFPVNPSGSVLMPSKEPYNKLEKMREANLLVKSDEYTKRTTEFKVTFAPNKTIFVYNGETYSFEACTFPYEIEYTKSQLEQKASSDTLSSDFTKPSSGNETKVLIVKVPNTDSGEPSCVTDQFESDDVCIPMCSNTFKVEPKKLEHEIQEQVIKQEIEENTDEENQIVQEVVDEYIGSNNSAEESESGIENNSGVLIKITSADSFESDITECSDHDDLEEDQNTVLIINNLNNDFESNQSEKNKFDSLPNFQENLIIFQKSLKHQRKSNNKLCTTKSTNGIKSKFEKSNKKLYKSLDQTESNMYKKTNSIQKSKSTEKKSKLIDIDITPNCSSECSSHINMERPKSSVERKKSEKRSARPFTAPVPRTCCQWGQPRLPEYNGLRSEYGLSAEQLRERKRAKIENNKARLMRKENKIKEEEEKQKQNEAKFCAWLENKREQAHKRYLRNQHMFLEANSITTYPAPTSHLKKMGSLRSNKISKIHRKCISLEEILVNAKPREEKTYRIYLGVTVD